MIAFMRRNLSTLKIIFILFILVINNYIDAKSNNKLRNYNYVLSGDSTLLDSLGNLPDPILNVTCATINFDSIFTATYGHLIWFDFNVKRLTTDSLKYQLQNVYLFENGLITIDAQIDSYDTTIVYCNKSNYECNQCDSVWTSNIAIGIIDSSHISLSSSNNVFIEIYKAFRIGEPYLDRFSLLGNNVNYIHNFDLEIGVTYIFVVRNNQNDIINVKKVWR